MKKLLLFTVLLMATLMSVVKVAKADIPWPGTEGQCLTVTVYFPVKVPSSNWLGFVIVMAPFSAQWC